MRGLLRRECTIYHNADVASYFQELFFYAIARGQMKMPLY